MDIQTILRATGRIFAEELFCGSCFLIQSQTAIANAFAVTATHCISEALASRKPIHVRFYGGERISATVVESFARRPYGHDIALLRLEKAPLGVTCLPCSVSPTPHGEGILVGAPQGTYTERTYFGVTLKGEETVQSAEVEGCSQSQAVVAAYSQELSEVGVETWRGISGGPIVIQTDVGGYELVGVITRLDSQTSSRGYGTPSRYIAELCDKANIRLVTLRVDPLANELSIASDFHKLAESILVDLENPGREKHSWNAISSLFFRGVDIEPTLEKVRNDSSDDCDKAVIEYFIGRIGLKKGDYRESPRHFLNIVNNSSALSGKLSSRLIPNCEARLFVEVEPIKHSDREKRFTRIISGLETVPCDSAEYVNYEVASIIGLEAMKWFDTPSAIKANYFHVSRLVQSHCEILRENPDGLRHQLITSNYIRFLSFLWGGETDSGSFETLVADGFSTAKFNKNSIYATQTILFSAIRDMCRENHLEGLTKAFFAVDLLKEGGVTLGHEGLRQQLGFLSEHVPWNANAIKKYYQFGFDTQFMITENVPGTRLTISDIMSSATTLLRYRPSWEKVYDMDMELIGG